MIEMQLPGMLAPYSSWSAHSTFMTGYGWDVTLRHKHLGESLNCPYVVRMEGLSYNELEQLIEDYIEVGRQRFTWDSEAVCCRPVNRS